MDVFKFWDDYLKDLPSSEESKSKEFDWSSLVATKNPEPETKPELKILDMSNWDESKFIQEPIPDGACYQHPNDPALWAELQFKLNGGQNRVVNNAGRYFRPRDIPMDPRLIQQRETAAQQYITNRGFFNYPRLYNPSIPGQRWVPDFRNIVEKKLNDSTEFAKPYYYPEWMNDVYDKYTGENVSKYEREHIYEYRAERQKKMMEEQAQSADAKLKENPFKGIKAGKKDPYKEKRVVGVTPSIDPKYLDFANQVLQSRKEEDNDPSNYVVFGNDGGNVVDPEGEPAFLLSAATDAVNAGKEIDPSYREKVFEQIYRDKILAESEHPYEDGEEPKGYYSYEPQPQTNSVPTYYGNLYKPPVIRSPWTYTSNWNIPSYLLPPRFEARQYTREELESGRIPFVITEATKDIKVKRYGQMKNPGHIDDPIKVGWITYTIDEFGNELIVEGRNPYTGKDYTPEEIEEENSKRCQARIKMEKYVYEAEMANQLKTDDCYRFARELSRYNQEAALLLLWYHTYADRDVYNILHRAMIKQLIEYRNNDPFAKIKSSVSVSRDVILIDKPIKVTEEMFEEAMQKECTRISKYFRHESDRNNTSRSVKTEAFKQLNALNGLETLEEKVAAMRKLVNIHVLPDDLELFRQYKEATIKSLTGIKMEQWTKYMHYYRMAKGQYSGLDGIGEYDYWWNEPTRQQNAPARQYTVDDKAYDYYMNLLLVSGPQNREKAQQSIDKIDRKLCEYSKSQLDKADTFEKYNQALRNIEVVRDTVDKMLKGEYKPYRNYNYDSRAYTYGSLGKVMFPYANPTIPSYANFERAVTPMMNPEAYQNNRQIFLNSIFTKGDRGSLL